jgi:hypothetical protein
MILQRQLAQGRRTVRRKDPQAASRGNITGKGFPVAKLFLLFGVIDHALEIHDDRRFVANYPGIVPYRQERDIAGMASQTNPIVHQDLDGARNLVLKVRGFAALGLGQRLDRRGPFPSWLKSSAANHRATDLYNFHFPMGKAPDFTRLPKTLEFCSLRGNWHIRIPFVTAAMQRCLSLF